MDRTRWRDRSSCRCRGRAPLSSEFADWRTTLVHDGVQYTPREGPRLSAIRVTENLRPLASISDLARPILSQLEAVTDEVVVSPHEPLVTFEGEHAALLRINGRRHRNRTTIEYQLGFVFGDESYTGIVAYCTDESMFPGFRTSLRAFVLHQELRLGTRRARRFLYTPPPWRGRARSLRAEWYPPAYPRHPARILIMPAVPCEQSFREIEAELQDVFASRGFTATRRSPKVRVTTEHGLSGWQWHLADERKEIIAAALLDDRYGYHLRLETDAEHLEADRAVFRAVLESVRGVPAMSAGQADALLRAMTPV